jgi:mannose-6-phosphate isomerase
MSEFKIIAGELIDWAHAQALPLWANKGHDDTGGIYEFLNMDGSPITGLRRVRVQARMAYAYAHAGALGWYKSAEEVSDYAWKYVLGPGSAGAEDLPGDGYQGCAHLLNTDGSLHDGLRDTYAQAFVILAGVWRFKAFGDTHALDIAKQTLTFLDTYAKADNGGWFEGIPHARIQSLPRRQNPHMHMFEALLALYEATKDAAYLARLDDLFDLFTTRFFDGQTATIHEFFDQNWTPLISNGTQCEPGHMMEWVWLLREYERMSGKDVGTYANVLYESALNIGLSPKTGLLYDKVTLETLTPVPTHRTWPQTEFVRASLAQARAGHPHAQDTAKRIIGLLCTKYFAVPCKGGWADQLDETGNIITDTIPASTFYHIISACAEVDRYTKDSLG